MASKMRKFSASLDIDGNLCAEGAESELSLADDADEFSESFSGKLSLIADDSSQHTSDESEIRENGKIAHEIYPLMYCQTNFIAKPILTCVKLRRHCTEFTITWYWSLPPSFFSTNPRPCNKIKKFYGLISIRPS